MTIAKRKRNSIVVYTIVIRWRKRASGEWVGILEGMLWMLTQKDNYVSYQVVEPSKKIKLENESQYESILKNYFQWDVDLEHLYSEWSKADPNFSKVAPNFQGVRMLRQDPVENLFSFICSSNNNIQRYLHYQNKFF